MAYIGIDPNVGDITFQKFTGDGSTTSFTLAQNVASGEAILVTVGNVVQEPGASASYTAHANTLTFSEAPANTDEILCASLVAPLTSPCLSQCNYTSTLQHQARQHLLGRIMQALSWRLAATMWMCT